MTLRARSLALDGQTVRATMLPGEPPSLFVQDAEGRGLGRLTVAAALHTYDVVDASPAERLFLARAGFPFGGTQ